MGHERTCWAAGKESALPLKADMLYGGEETPLSAISGHGNNCRLERSAPLTRQAPSHKAESGNSG